MNKTAKMQEEVSKLWSVQDVLEAFEVTYQTIHNWRAMETDPLPAVTIPNRGRPSIRFVPEDVRAWAARQNLTLKEIRS